CLLSFKNTCLFHRNFLSIRYRLSLYPAVED
ncbi:MAG: hypothetical protein ACI8P3_004129, partial [Saprospiraceae bacterium]